MKIRIPLKAHLFCNTTQDLGRGVSRDPAACMCAALVLPAVCRRVRQGRGAVEGLPQKRDAESAVNCRSICLCSTLAAGEVVIWANSAGGDEQSRGATIHITWQPICSRKPHAPKNQLYCCAGAVSVMTGSLTSTDPHQRSLSRCNSLTTQEFAGNSCRRG
jgi:hypothetical protein